MNRKELLDALTLLQPGFGKNETVENSTFVHFLDKIIMSYNDDISVTVPFVSNIHGSVHVKELYELLKRITDDDIDVRVNKNELLITAGKMKSRIKFNPEVDIPILDTDGKTKELDGNFFKYVECILNTACINPTFLVLRDVVHCFGDYLEGTDKIRVTRCYMDKMFRSNVLIPIKAAKELIKYNATHVAFDEPGWLKFYRYRNPTEEEVAAGYDEETMEIMFAVRIIDVEEDEDYPNIDKLIEAEKKTETFFIIPKEDINAVLSRITVFANTEYQPDQFVDIELKSGIMTISSKSDFGSIQEEIEVGYESDEPCRFSVNPNFLNILKYADTQCSIVNNNRLDFEIEYLGNRVLHYIRLAETKR